MLSSILLAVVLAQNPTTENATTPAPAATPAPPDATAVETVDPVGEPQPDRGIARGAGAASLVGGVVVMVGSVLVALASVVMLGAVMARHMDWGRGLLTIGAPEWKLNRPEVWFDALPWLAWDLGRNGLVISFGALVMGALIAAIGGALLAASAVE